MSRMKEGEEAKTKTYSALIWTQKAIDRTDLEFLTNTKVLLSFLIGCMRRDVLMTVCVCVCVGSEDRSEDSTESPASPAAGGPTETRPLHERHLPGQTPLHPKAVHTGRHVSLQDTVK